MSDRTHPTGGVFLSYAREDAGTARRIAEAMRAFGVEVWFDENELRGGDAWDAQIKKQIRECGLFIPVISASTQARTEGYFRREWRVALERMQDMASGVPFLLPIVIDDTSEKGAVVPEEFLRVQWTRLPKGIPSPQFVEQVKRQLERRVPTSPSPAPAAPVSAAPAKSKLPLGLIAAIGAVLVGGVVVAAFLRRPAPAAPAVPTATAAVPPPAAKPARVADKSIAVLPFTNMSEDKDNAFFADGVHEDVLTNLALIRELRVVSRTTVQSYRNTTKSMKQIAEELGVTYILEGSVRRVGNKVRITGQLIHAATDEHVWAQKYDRDLTDIFTIQSELSQEIATALKAALSPEEKSFITRKPTAVSAAYDEYLRGRGLRNRSPTTSKSALTSAERSFQQAVTLDPGFSSAWGELAVVHALHVFWGLDSSPARRAMGETAIAQAIRLAPDSPDVMRLAGTYAYYARRDYATATAQYEKVLRVQPNDPTAYQSLGLIQRRQGRWAEALVNLRKAVELDPANVGYVRNLLQAVRACRRWDEARAMQQRMAALVPEEPRERWSITLLDWEQTGSTKTVDQLLASMPAAFKESALGVYILWNWAQARDDYETFKRLERLQPDFPDEVAPVQSALAAALYYYSHGEVAAARTRIEQFVPAAREQVQREPENFRAASILSALEFLMGNAAESLRLAKRAADLMPESRDAVDGPNARYSLALAYALVGEADRALAELAHLLSVPTQSFVATIRADHGFFKLRGDPRFEALLIDPKNNAPLF